SQHFYRSKYDYREQWVNFTKRLGSLVTLDGLAPQLLAAVLETVGATVGILYLRDDGDGRYHVTSAVGIGRPTEPLRADQPVLASLNAARTPLILDNTTVGPWLEQRVARVFTEGSGLVLLRGRDAATRVVLVRAQPRATVN